jgi:ribosomal protein S1
VVKVGDRVKVKVLQVDEARKRIGLSMKALQAAAPVASHSTPSTFNAPRFSGRR